jgi:hypothetical protein
MKILRYTITPQLNLIYIFRAIYSLTEYHVHIHQPLFEKPNNILERLDFRFSLGFVVFIYEPLRFVIPVSINHNLFYNITYVQTISSI